MKPLLIAFTLVCAVVTTSAFAKDVKVTPVVLHTFETSFKSAQDVQWSRVDALYLATFTLDQQKVLAFFSSEGALVATGRYLSKTQLPISLQTNLKQNYDNYAVVDLFEVSNEEGTSYYVNLASAEKMLTLKSEAGSTWSVFKKVKK